MQKRLVVLFLLVLVSFGMLAIRLILIQRDNGRSYTMQVLSQQAYDNKSLPYKRGRITDAKGTVLADSQLVYNVIIDARQILEDEAYLEPSLNAAERLGVNKEELRTYITEHPGCGESDLVKYLGYSRGSTAHQIQKLIRNNRIREVSYRSTIRYYPAGVPETETDLLSAASAKEKPAAIIKALGGGPLTLSALSKETGNSTSSLRWHLTRLEEDGVISAEKKGKSVWYFLRK